MGACANKIHLRTLGWGLVLFAWISSGCGSKNFNLSEKQASSSIEDIAPTEKADILLIIDSTSSMGDERKKLRESLNTLISKINGTDWRVGVMTASGSGDLLPIDKPTRSLPSVADCMIMRPAATKFWVSYGEADAFNSIVQTLHCGASREIKKAENGLTSLYNALIKFKSQTGSIYSFLRPDAHWVTIVLSDGDEKVRINAQTQKAAVGVLPSQLNEFIRAYSLPFKTFSFHGIVVRPGDNVCLSRVTSSSYGTNSQSFGVRYAEFASSRQGLTESVCAPDYATVLNAFAEDFKAKERATDLRCEPRPESIKVFLGGEVVQVDYRIDGTLLILSASAPKGVYKFDYACRVARS